jgi:hypothetical protein
MYVAFKALIDSRRCLGLYFDLPAACKFAVKHFIDFVKLS